MLGKAVLLYGLIWIVYLSFGNRADPIDRDERSKMIRHFKEPFPGAMRRVHRIAFTCGIVAFLAAAIFFGFREEEESTIWNLSILTMWFLGVFAWY
jgi:hypothetical protein